MNTEWHRLSPAAKLWEILLMSGGVCLLCMGMLAPAIYREFIKDPAPVVAKAPKDTRVAYAHEFTKRTYRK